MAGDQWDFVALDPDSRLVLSVFVGKRLADNAEVLLQDVKSRLAGAPELISPDEWPGYPEVIREIFGEEVTPPRTGKPGRPAVRLEQVLNPRRGLEVHPLPPQSPSTDTIPPPQRRGLVPIGS